MSKYVFNGKKSCDLGKSFQDISGKNSLKKS
jgi:hypothetical protein